MQDTQSLYTFKQSQIHVETKEFSVFYCHLCHLQLQSLNQVTENPSTIQLTRKKLKDHYVSNHSIYVNSIESPVKHLEYSIYCNVCPSKDQIGTCQVESDIDVLTRQHFFEFHKSELSYETNSNQQMNCGLPSTKLSQLQDTTMNQDDELSEDDMEMESGIPSIRTNNASSKLESKTSVLNEILQQSFLENSASKSVYDLVKEYVIESDDPEQLFNQKSFLNLIDSITDYSLSNYLMADKEKILLERRIRLATNICSESENLCLNIMNSSDQKSWNLNLRWISSSFELKQICLVSFSASAEESILNQIRNCLQNTDIPRHVFCIFIETSANACNFNQLKNEFSPLSENWKDGSLLMNYIEESIQIVYDELKPFLVKMDLTSFSPLIEICAKLILPFQKVKGEMFFLFSERLHKFTCFNKLDEFRKRHRGSFSSLGPLMMSKVIWHLREFKGTLKITNDLNNLHLDVVYKLLEKLEWICRERKANLLELTTLSCILDPLICKTCLESLIANSPEWKNILIQKTVEEGSKLSLTRDQVQKEIDGYWNCLLESNSLPGALVFWKNSSQKYPVLSRLARQYLSLV